MITRKLLITIIAGVLILFAYFWGIRHKDPVIVANAGSFYCVCSLVPEVDIYFCNLNNCMPIGELKEESEKKEIKKYNF
jgi:hypothetical protein